MKLSNHPVVYKYTFNSLKVLSDMLNFDCMSNYSTWEEGYNVLVEDSSTPISLSDLKKLDGYNGMCYIGSTVNEENRYKQHKYNVKGKTKFANFCRRYGFDAFDYEVLSQLGEDETVEVIRTKEQEYLDEYQPFDNNGFNLQRKTVLTAVDIEKILNNNNGISVVKLSKDTHEILEIYRTLSDAAKYNNVTVSSLSSVIKEKINSAGGYYWLELDMLYELYDNELFLGKVVDSYLLPMNTNITDKEPICIFNKFNVLEMIMGSKNLTCEFLNITKYLLNKSINDRVIYKSRFYLLRQSDVEKEIKTDVRINEAYTVLDFVTRIDDRSSRIAVFDNKGFLIGVYKNKTMTSEIMDVSKNTLNKYLDNKKDYKHHYYRVYLDVLKRTDERLLLVGQRYLDEIQ